MGPDAVILVFWLLSFKPAFSLSSFTFIKRRFSSFLLSAIRVVKVKVIQLCLTLVTPCTVACQALLSMEFSRQEYWSGLPFPFPGDLPDPRIEPKSPALQADSLPTELWGKPIRVVSSAYLRLLIFLPAILIPVCESSSLAFCRMYSAYKLNKQGDNIQPWCISFPILNQSVVPCPVLTIASWLVYRFLRRQVRWSGIPMSLRIFHSLLWSTQSKALV